jgi:hypothetical protein
MPYKTDKLKLGRLLSRRVKLQDSQKDEIKQLHAQGSSIHSLSKIYKVSRRLIQFILFPERQEQNIKLRNERGGSKIYYNREEHTAAIKDYRRYKYKMLKDTIK